MKTNFERRKSLQELERDDWGEPECDTYLVQTCHRLRRVPLEEYTREDLRIMIGQKISLLFLVPLALEKLQENPVVEAKTYPGDLLEAILHVPLPFWNLHTDMRDVLRQVISQARTLLESLEEADADFVRDVLERAPALP